MRRAVPAAVLLFALAACGDDPVNSGNGGAGPADGAGVPAWASQPPRPKCADVFVPGKKIAFPPAEAAKGCSDPDGGIVVVGSSRCGDGRHLFQVDAYTGAKRGWGFDGEAYHASPGEVASDPGYAAADKGCHN